MKLRVQNQTMRFRLNKEEVDALGLGQTIQSILDFGDAQLEYYIKSGNSWLVSFRNNKIEISIPFDKVKTWVESDQIVMKHKDKISLSIEKDFKCLSADRVEDESKLFPHPKEGKLKC